MKKRTSLGNTDAECNAALDSEWRPLATKAATSAHKATEAFDRAYAERDTGTAYVKLQVLLYAVGQLESLAQLWDPKKPQGKLAWDFANSWRAVADNRAKKFDSLYVWGSQ